MVRATAQTVRAQARPILRELTCGENSRMIKIQNDLEPTDLRRHIAPSTTRYEMFASSLIADIESGKYPVGTLLPAEPELCAQYALSRHTVREGVRKLVEMGLVSRQRGIGTRVISTAVGPNDFLASTSLETLFRYVEGTWLKILGEQWITADERLAKILDCKLGQSWLEVTTCRYQENIAQPLSHTVLYIAPGFAGIRPHLGELNRPVYRLIEEHYGHKVRDLQLVVSALSIPPDVAAWLQCEPHLPGLHVVRRYRGANDSYLSNSVSIYPQTRFDVSIRYQLNWSGS